MDGLQRNNSYSQADTQKYNSQMTTDVSAYCSFAVLFINKTFSAFSQMLKMF